VSLFGEGNADIFSKSLPKESPQVEKKASVSTGKMLEEEDDDDDLFSTSSSK